MSVASPIAEREAESLERAQELVVQAREAASRGAYQESIKLFKAAQDLLPSPDNLFAIASIFERIEGACQQALEAWDRFEKICADCTLRDKGLERIMSLKSQCSVKLTIDSKPIGAQVTFDGEGRGVTPITIPSVAGRHTLTLHLEGFHPVKESIILLKGSQVDVKSVVLNPLEKRNETASPVSSSPTALKDQALINQGEGGTPQQSNRSLYAPIEDLQARQNKDHTAAIVMVSSGVLLSALGVWSYLSAVEEANEINRAKTSSELEAASQNSNVATKEALGYAGLGLGVGLGAFGIIKLTF